MTALALVFVEPALVPDLRAAGLDPVEHDLAPGIWIANCPACTVRGWPDAHRALRLVQIEPGEPGDASCAAGCAWLDIVAALRELIAEAVA
jgi:hypothetical protein